jgi:hypothetical protein
MSVQALFNTLGSAGAAAGENRQAQFQDRATAQQMALRLATFQRQQQVSEALERYRAGELAKQTQLAERPDWTPAREPYQAEDKQWYQDFIDRRSGKIMRSPVGTPLSNVNKVTGDADIAQRQKDLQELKGKQATALEEARAKHAQDLAKFKATHRAASGAAGATPLAAERWYRTLGGAQVDLQIKSLESMLKSMELTSLGGPEQLYQNGLYIKTQQQLAQLYAKADSIMQQSMQRAGGAAGGPAAGGSIVVTPEDMAGKK